MNVCHLAYEQCTIWLMNSVLMNLAYEQCAIWLMNSGLMNSVLMNLAYEQCAISAQCMHVCMCVCQDALAYNYVEPLIRQLFTILAEHKLIILIASL